MIICEATVKDVFQLDKLINSAYRGEFSKKGWTTEADLLHGIRTDKESLEKLIDKPGAIFLKFCNDENILLGCVFLEKKNNKRYVGMLTVSPTEQAKGIGKQLLLAAEHYAIEQKCSLLEMSVISVRSELTGWYQRNGYFKTGERKPFPSDSKSGIPKQPLEFVIMQKNI